MNSTHLPALRYLNLRLVVLAEEPDLVQVECSGDICLPDFQPEQEPLAELLGPQVYSLKVLLDLEKANCLDTSGVSWLVYCHGAFQKAGGQLVLHSIPPRVRYILQLLQMEHVLHTAADLPAARTLAPREKE